MNQVEAYELMEKVHMMHLEVFTESVEKRKDYEKCLDDKQFTNLSVRETDVLNNVAPFKNLKRLVSNINTWSEEENVLEAFIEAIERESVMEL